jgi:mannose-6-phosphate isomerase-like protein (cupin superfamily)
VWDVEPFDKNGVRLVFFAPRGVDHQTAHEEDEFYFITSGTGEIIIGDKRHAFEPGNAFFVPAKVDHHFENFTADFTSWAIFF